MEVLAPGLLTTVQGRGREGFRHLGVGFGGALDPDAQAIANLLVGNAVSAATLEIALAGPTLRFERATRIALCGANFDADIDGETFPGWRRADLPGGSVLRIGGCRQGARAWLAVSGGIRVADILGSASTDLRGGFGGVEGRALRAGDRLHVEPFAETVERVRIAPWWIDPLALDPDPSSSIRVLPGSDATDPADGLFANAWTIAPASDRQGLRLTGTPLALRDAREYVSEPIVPGTLQLPPGGQPIVLLADAQTHGGYPRIGHAIRADRGRLAQLRAGDAIRFAPCTPAEALAASRERAHTLARIALAVAGRIGVAPPSASA
ncbi:biotin-dependent carboxyltransferase family protein [Pseudoluteimonas lycopersici]|uniref:Biotin-dependent carboxyltransferase family protein n=1 Tax=Pseudoluteimonas lycopersici TaxID=1324796 RepID=A0A516V859_9GAMM|nr:biotin-dependent carboxyltransferase family protein [Lysobacter lycopersici]